MSRNLWRITKQRPSVLHKKDNSRATREERLFGEVLFVIVQSMRQMPSRGVGGIVRPVPIAIKPPKGYLQRGTKSSVFCPHLAWMAIYCANSLEKQGVPPVACEWRCCASREVAQFEHLCAQRWETAGGAVHNRIRIRWQRTDAR